MPTKSKPPIPLSIQDNNAYNKLLMLFVLDTMDIPMTDNTIVVMCTSHNSWITYMDCMLTLPQLAEAGFAYKTAPDKKNNYYSVTPDGRECLSHFFSQIPASVRNEIKDYIKEHRMSYRRRQEYSRDYFRNSDGNHTVVLKIVDPVQTTMELKLNVPTRMTAKQIYNKWEEKAAQVYTAIHELLIEE